jgi:hypothetical protein
MIIRGPSRTEKRFKSLTRLIAEELKKAILAGKLVPGERLSEDKLSGLLKISKFPSVRHSGALRRMALLPYFPITRPWLVSPQLKTFKTPIPLQVSWKGLRPGLRFSEPVKKR